MHSTMDESSFAADGSPAAGASAINIISFPVKLQSMLDETEAAGLSHIVSWELKGTAFRVHRPEEFVQQIMSQWFNQTKYKSFQRQLNLYGFCRVTRGPQKGCYLHDKFQRNKPDLAQTITRKKACNNNSDNGDGDSAETSLSDELELTPAWLPDVSREVLEPTPITEMGESSMCRKTGHRLMSPGVAATSKSHEYSSMMNAFESYFQSNVAEKHVLPTDDTWQKPTGNALKRILDQIIEPETVAEKGETLTIDSEHWHTSHPPMDPEGHNHEDDGICNKHLVKRTPRCAVFPDKLHDMLEYCEANGLENTVASWEVQGRAFRIRSIDLFMKQIMTKFFKLTKFESLQRQLNLYGFNRVARGRMKGCYHHPLFIKGGRSLSKDMQRRKPEDEVPLGTTNASVLASKFSNGNAFSRKRNRSESANPEMGVDGTRATQEVALSVPSMPMHIPIVDWDDFQESDDEEDDSLDAMARACTGSDDGDEYDVPPVASSPLQTESAPLPFGTMTNCSTTMVPQQRAVYLPLLSPSTVLSSGAAIHDLRYNNKNNSNNDVWMHHNETRPNDNANSSFLVSNNGNDAADGMWAFGFVPTIFQLE